MFFRECFAVVLLSFIVSAYPQGKGHRDVKFVNQKPKYEYGYVISDKNGNAQGHVESRDGVYALGRYYVNLPNGSGQKVTYFADNWGYHPLVSYASATSKGSSRTQFAMGVAALGDRGLVSNAISDVVAVTPQPFPVSPVFSAQPGFLLLQPTAPTPASQTTNTIQQDNRNEEPSQEESRQLETVTEKHFTTVLHIPGLKQVLQLATDHINRELERDAAAYNRSESALFNATAGKTDNEIVTSPQLLVNNSKAALQQVYLTTSMRPIVAAGIDQTNNVVTSNSGQSGYNEVRNNPTRQDSDPDKNLDSSPQSSNSVLINEPISNSVDNGAEQLAALQAGIQFISPQPASDMSVQKSVQMAEFSYKTTVDVQQGITFDVKENEDGSISLSQDFGRRLQPANNGTFRGLGYQNRLVLPSPPAPQQQQLTDVNEYLRQEAEIQAVQQNIEKLQQEIVSQIDEKHAEQERKHNEEQQERASHLENLQKVNAINSAQSSNKEAIQNVVSTQLLPANIPFDNNQNQILVGPSEVPSTVPIPIQYTHSDNSVVDGQHVANNQIEELPQRIKSQSLGGILTLNIVNPTTDIVPPAPVQINYEDSSDLVPPPAENNIPEPVLAEPYPTEPEANLLPVPPSPTLFPVKIETPVIPEKPAVVETTKLDEVEKPMVVAEPAEKVTEVENPVPVLQPAPIPVTNFVHVERPFPVSMPFAVTHPVPVPVVMPQPVEVPIPQLLPVPEIVNFPLNQFFPVFLPKKEVSDFKPSPEITSDNLQSSIFHQDSKLTGGQTFWDGIGDLHLTEDAFKKVFGQSLSFGDSFQSGLRGLRNAKSLKNLRIEYGFKPPLRPSVQITEEVKPSMYGPSVRQH